MNKSVNNRARPSLNWFSPLPPERSGIADFTANLMPLLADRAATQFISNSSLPIAIGGQGQASPEERQLEALNRADINVFNIGNNAAFHEGIWRLSTVAGGVVILHDARLQHLFGGMFLVNQNARAHYIEMMRHHYGIEGEAAAGLMAEGRVSPELVSERFSLVEAAIHGARGIVVHSREAYRAVTECSSVPVIRLDLPHDVGSTISRSGRDGKGVGCDVVVFGHLGPNRRIDAIFRALAQVDVAKSPRLHLIGDVWNKTMLHEFGRSLGIEDRITFHGHVPEAELEARLVQADLVVNLRWPTMGEASYTQLKAFQHAVPTVVSRAGWYAELPSDCVIHIEPGREVSELIAAFKALASDPACFRAMGVRGRELLVRKHQPVQYVERLIAFGNEEASARGKAQRDLAAIVAAELAPFSQRMTDRIAEWVDARLNSYGAR